MYKCVSFVHVWCVFSLFCFSVINFPVCVFVSTYKWVSVSVYESIGLGESPFMSKYVYARCVHFHSYVGIYIRVYNLRTIRTTYAYMSLDISIINIHLVISIVSINKLFHVPFITLVYTMLVLFYFCLIFIFVSQSVMT